MLLRRGLSSKGHRRMEVGQNAKRRQLANFLQLSRPEKEKRVEMKVQMAN